MFIVYELWHPIDHICFYVGKGTGDRQRRYDHLSEGRRFLERGSMPRYWNHQKVGIIASLLSDNIEPEFRVVLRTNDEEAFRYEMFLISSHGRRCENSGTLTNLTLGGDGVRGAKRLPITEETRRKISESSKGRRMSEEGKAALSNSLKAVWASGERKPTPPEAIKKRTEANTGKKRPENFKKLMMYLQTGKKASPETKQKISQASKGRKHSEETKAKISEKMKIIRSKRKVNVDHE